MRPSKFVALLIMLLVCGLALAACGSSSDSTSSDDQDQITEVIKSVSIGSDPAACTEFATQQFLEQTEAETGQAAVDSCKKDQADTSDDPDAVETTDISVDGDTATATTSFTGGTFDGQSLDLSLVKEDDQWKVDKIDDIPNFDVDRFATALEASVQQGSDPLTEAQATCLGDQLRKAGADQLKQVILAGDSDALGALFQTCAG